MTRVFILGAGASRFAGYPLALDLWAFIRDCPYVEENDKRGASAVTQEMERILKLLPPVEHDRPNLEETFTFLDLTEIGTTELLQLRHAKWAELRPKMMRMISWAFQWRETNFQEELVAKRNFFAASVLDKWADFFRQGDTIITFNWDLLHESALWRAKKWHYADGYGFLCSDAPSGVHSPTKFLKLHGSVNWAQGDRHDLNPAIEDKSIFFPGASDCAETYYKGARNWNEGRYFILPSYLKHMSANRLLLSLWNQASDALAAASEVIVIGFQLHPADAPARQLIGTSLFRNRSLSDVLVISPRGGVDQWDSFCFGIGKKRKRVEKRFEEWVMEV